MAEGTILVVGGTGGIGTEVARHYAEAGNDVVITGRDLDRANSIAAEIGPTVSGLAVDLSKPEDIAGALSGLGASPNGYAQAAPIPYGCFE